MKTFALALIAAIASAQENTTAASNSTQIDLSGDRLLDVNVTLSELERIYEPIRELQEDQAELLNQLADDVAEIFEQQAPALDNLQHRQDELDEEAQILGEQIAQQLEQAVQPYDADLDRLDRERRDAEEAAAEEALQYILD